MIVSISYILLAAISALGNVFNSLITASSTKSGSFNSQTCVIYSIIPSFVICVFAVIFYDYQMSIAIFSLLCLKNVLYGLGFYLRFRAIERLGAFNGALMAASQPVLISVLSIIILNETLSVIQWVSILIVCIAILLPSKSSDFSWKDIANYVIIPTVLFSATVIFDRYLLVEHLDPMNFFVWDKISVFPAVIASMFIAGKLSGVSLAPSRTGWNVREILIVAFLGITWGIASYTYAVALSGEKAAMISLVRNLAFPLTAVLGGVIFREAVNQRQYFSLFIISTGILLGTLY